MNYFIGKNEFKGKIDTKRIEEIRNSLRKRYIIRDNIRRIFKEWDFHNNGEISIFNAHSMINKLDIAINYNETRALISMANSRNTESLNVDEFINLVYEENPKLNLHLNNFECNLLFI